MGREVDERGDTFEGNSRQDDEARLQIRNPTQTLPMDWEITSIQFWTAGLRDRTQDDLTIAPRPLLSSKN